MRFPIRVTGLFLALLSLFSTALGDSRLESEFKLTVPPEQREAIWNYLNEAYGPGGSMLAPWARNSRFLSPPMNFSTNTTTRRSWYFSTPVPVCATAPAISSKARIVARTVVNSYS